MEAGSLGGDSAANVGGFFMDLVVFWGEKVANL